MFRASSKSSRPIVSTPSRSSFFSIFFFFLALAAPAAALEKPRLIVLTDIGGDPDDQQAMIRLMTCANEFDIEGLIASAAGTPKELQEDIVKPELIREIVAAYGKVRDNLESNTPGYPAAPYLLERIKSGNPHRGEKNLGEGSDSEGSRWIIAVADRPDPRPVNITIWGGSTELAQALWRVRHDRSPAELKKFLSRIRVYFIEHQDDTGPWINAEFPDFFCVLGQPAPGADKRTAVYRGMYLGGDESLTSLAWLDAHVRTGHGPLGALYPPKTWTAPNPHGALKEGDTPSWFYFLPNGLSDSTHPEWGGWGGRFQGEGPLFRDAKDRVGDATDFRASVWRWRPAFQADFQARMDWCVKPPGQANHAPEAAFDGKISQEIVFSKSKPGARVRLSAAGSRDPDADALAYRWWVYPEAGNYGRAVSIDSANAEQASLEIPQDAAGKTIHVILEVTDNGDPKLTSYRRIIIAVD